MSPCCGVFPRTGRRGRVRIQSNTSLMRQHVAKTVLCTKRICPETGRKFYDLNKDPIVSPYTGQSYPRRFFDTSVASIVEEEEEEKEVDLEETSADLVSLE